ncbi:MAG: hypothetical protein ACRD4S_16945 [Candidatus Acidiferrales bacterium]
MAGPSIREQIIAQIVTLLAASGAPAGLTIGRERVRPLETTELPAVMVYFNDEKPKTLDNQQYKAPITVRELTIAAECRAVGSQSLSADAALDPLIVWVTTQILGNESFQGLANGVEEGATIWWSREGDVAIAAATINFIIKYRTSRLDPTSRT